MSQARTIEHLEEFINKPDIDILNIYPTMESGKTFIFVIYKDVEHDRAGTNKESVSKDNAPKRTKKKRVKSD